MELYLDDCSDSNVLAAFLRNAGHRVETPRSTGKLGRPDPEHLGYAAQHRLTLITKNPDDFRDLHEVWAAEGRPHPGILLICEDNIKGKDMEPGDIVRAIETLLASRLPIANEIHVLNHWRSP